MTAERIAGLFRQWAGWMNQYLGELSGDALRAESGRRDQVIGKTQQRNAIENERFHLQLREFQNRNRNWTQ
jgi:uncharacterized protein YjbJ (UPF0337 family)